MAERLRFGIVGTGYWARSIHAAGVAEHPDTELVGVWGRDRAKAEAVAGEHGVAGYDDFDALLEQVDALAFALNPDAQAELAIRAAGAGKHLLLEKPIATDPDLAERLAAAVDDAGVSSVVFFTHRFVPEWEAWLEEVRGEQFIGARAEWLVAERRPGNPYFGSVWRDERGALWDLGPHVLATLVPVLGEVTAVTGAHGQGDLVHLVLTHASGATSAVSVSLTMPPGIETADAPTYLQVVLYGEPGWREPPRGVPDAPAAYGRALGELVDSVRAGETSHRCDVRFGRDVVVTLARCEDALGG
jgi:predicted dehydrogenase